MTSYTDLQDKVSRAIQDPDRTTFVTDDVDDLIAAAYAEIALTVPNRFIEEIAPVDDQIAYQVLSDTFDDPNDDIRIVSVEVWQVEPKRPLRVIEALSSHVAGLGYSEAGWRFWGGFVNLPYRWVQYLNGHEDDYLLRITGYSPWLLDTEAESLPFTAGVVEAIVVYCNVAALERLNSNRALFSQWQTETNNTDVSPAALAGYLNSARENWHRMSRAIRVLTEAP